MSNLQSARAALEAELEHAQQGLAFYQERVASLTKALNDLSSLWAMDGSAVIPGKSKAGARKGRQAKAAPPAQAKRRAAGDLPATGGDFWSRHITAEPKTKADIFNAAIATMKNKPTPEQIKALDNRLSVKLSELVKTGAVKDAGAGRERKFFIA